MPDSDDEPDAPVPERWRRGEVVVEEEEDEEEEESGEESGDDSAIVSDGDVEYDSASGDSLDLLDQQADAMERLRRGRQRRDESDEEDQPRRRRRRRRPPTPVYEDWEVMREMYEDIDNDCEEPPGYGDWPQLHADGWRPDDDSDAEWEEARQDALWESVKDKLRDPAVRDRLGMRAVEKRNDGRIERVVERFKYGTDFAEFEDSNTGDYRKAFFPVMKEVFGQEPYQAPPDPGLPRVLPEPRFLGFRHAFHSYKPVGDDDQLKEHPDGPLWCLCCQCTAKSLQKIMIARHKQSRILVVTGGDCASKMLGQNAYDQAQANDEAVRDLVL